MGAVVALLVPMSGVSSAAGVGKCDANSPLLVGRSGKVIILVAPDTLLNKLLLGEEGVKTTESGTTVPDNCWLEVCYGKKLDSGGEKTGESYYSKTYFVRHMIINRQRRLAYTNWRSQLIIIT